MRSDGPPRAAVLLERGSIVGGGYRVVRAIAEGGMGTVYEVEQLTTGARRALKAMHVQLAHDADLRARFVREARVAATIKSDHVAGVLDAGVDEATGVPYLVMELLEGRTLSNELRKRGRFEWPEVAEIMRQVCHGLGAAHDAGVVHRDVKPANVFLCASRTAGMPFVVKVLDFGIAKVVAEARDGATAVIGTPSWMAPEQTEENPVIGPRSDVWAIGLLAFALFVGRHYWPSGNHKGTPTAAVMRELVLGEIVAPSIRAASYECPETLPTGFDDWFARCVARDPSARFADANEARAAFEDLMRPYVREPSSSASLPIPLAPSIPAPSIPAPPVATARTEDSLTVAEGAASRSRTRMSGVASESRAPTPRWGFALPVATVASAAAVIAFAYATRTHEDPPIPALTSEAASAAVAPPPSVIVRLHGSNTVGADLGPALAEAFLKRRSGGAAVVRRTTGDDEAIVEWKTATGSEAIEVFAHGSATAFTDLASGACDIGMSSRKAKSGELGALGGLAPAASEHVVALDGIAVIVNPQNAVARLTKAQVAKVFSGELVRWKDVGGSDAPIHVLARDDKSGTFDSFKALALAGKPLVSGATRFEASDRLSDAVAGDADAIGFVGKAYVRSAKPLMVEDSKSEPLVASRLTIATEDYPLSRRLYLYTSSSSSEIARRFVDFALSEDGQAAVRAAGFVDLTPTCEPVAAACTRCTPAYRAATAGACRFNVNFRFDAAGQLDTRALRDLQRLVVAFARPEYAGRALVLVGFSDSTGGPTASLRRSTASARAVADQLRARGLRVGGTYGLGADVAIADDSTEEGRERNRRVELWLR